jgi:hypothetical protein
MTNKILHREEAKTLYDSLVAANNIFIRDFCAGFVQSRSTGCVTARSDAVYRVQFRFIESSSMPNVSVLLFIGDEREPIKCEMYADQAHFARAYELDL